jgi:hypothetical protein
MDGLQSVRYDGARKLPDHEDVPIQATHAVAEKKSFVKIETAEREAMFANCAENRVSERCDSHLEPTATGAV